LYALPTSFDSIPSFVKDVVADSRKKLEKLRGVASGHQELAALKRHITDDETKICSLEKANSELGEQLEVQRKAHQEQLKD
jgi:hypothetical protein